MTPNPPTPTSIPLTNITMASSSSEVPQEQTSRNPFKRQPAAIPPTVSDLHCFTETQGVITTTMFDVPGYKVIRVLGTVFGITVRCRNIGADLGMAFKSLAGGELPWYTKLMYNARNDAISRLCDQCLEKGGNAVIAMGFNQSDTGGGVAMQVTAYGTACVVEKIDPDMEPHPQLFKQDKQD